MQFLPLNLFLPFKLKKKKQLKSELKFDILSQYFLLHNIKKIDSDYQWISILYQDLQFQLLDRAGPWLNHVEMYCSTTDGGRGEEDEKNI